MLFFQKAISRSHRAASVITHKRFSSVQNGFMTSMHPDVIIPKVSLIEHSWRNFKDFPNHIATECAQTGRKYTFDDIRQKSENLGSSLRKRLNLERGDTVAIILPNIPEYPICIYGIILSGLRMTSINPTYTADEIQRQLKDSDAKLILTLNEHHGVVTQAVALLKKELPIAIIKTKKNESIPENTINFDEFLNHKGDTSGMDSLQNDEVVFVPYSSGTTGLPKGVLITGSNLLSVMCQLDSDDVRFFEKTSESHQDITPLVLPIFHIAGYSICVMSLLQAGVKLVTVSKFAPDLFLQCLLHHRPTILGLVPPLVIFLHSHPAVQTKHFENVRVVISGAAPLGKADETKLRQKIGNPFLMLQGYGLTETTGCALVTPISRGGQFQGTMGHPVPNCNVKVVNPQDPELKHLGPNEIGELLVKGPQVMKGYLKRPEETRNSFADGWFRTGDLVRYDGNQMIYFVDRIKDLIKVKGLQVAPVELEEILKSFPEVAEAGVIGIPHQTHGEVPRAYIVPKSGSKIDVKKLEEYVNAKVAPHKKLSGGVAVVDSIPKSASGKILKRELQLQYQNEKM